MITEHGGDDLLHVVACETTMLFSLIHPERGSSSQCRLGACERHRLVPSRFGDHYLTLSLMEPRLFFYGAWQSQTNIYP